MATRAINSEKVGKANAVLTGLTWIAEGVAGIMKNDQIAQLKSDAEHLPGVVNVVNDAINGKFSDIQIPDKFRNSISLEQMAAYVFSGKVAYDYSEDELGREIKKENTELMVIAKKLLSVYQRENMKSAVEKNKERAKQAQNPIDQTNKKNF